MNLEQLIIIIVVAAFVGLVIFYALSKKVQSNKWKETVIDKLNVLQKLNSTKEDIKVKSALIDADKLLDYVLIKRGVKGESIGARLKDAKSFFTFENYQKVWEAHKVRNRLVHEVEYTINTKDLSNHFWNLRTAIVKLID